ncbi:MAG: amidohydrolase family protein [Candidatus Peregrinibacteria bacterium]
MTNLRFKSLGILALAILFLTGFFWSPLNIIDTHEHITSLKKAEELLKVMKTKGIVQTVLLPAPIETLTLNGNKSFTGYRENMDEILRIAKKYPASFIPFCTISPLDEGALEILKDCVNRGGRGLKLYNGHSLYYDIFKMPLDSPVMDPIYAYAQEQQLPILYHVNISKYGNEFENVLKRYPNLKISVPHFMVFSTNLTRVADLLDRYPNLYTDISFGSEPFMAAGFRRISEHAREFQAFFERFQDRILFGTDMVLTDFEKKDSRYMRRILACYRNLLEKETFACQPVSDYYRSQKKLQQYYQSTKRLNGLDLDEDILKSVYKKNAEQFLQR